MTLFSGCCPS